MTPDPAWLAAELAKAPAHLSAEQSRRLRAVLLPRPSPATAAAPTPPAVAVS